MIKYKYSTYGLLIGLLILININISTYGKALESDAYYRGEEPDLHFYDLVYNENITLINNIIYTNESIYTLKWWWWDIETHPIGGNTIFSDSYAGGLVNFSVVIINNDNEYYIYKDFTNYDFYYLQNSAVRYGDNPNYITIDFKSITERVFEPVIFGAYMYFSYYNNSLTNIVVQTCFQKIVWNPEFNQTDYKEYIELQKDKIRGSIVIQVPEYVYYIISSIGFASLIYFLYWTNTCNNIDNEDNDRCRKNRMIQKQSKETELQDLQDLQQKLFQ